MTRLNIAFYTLIAVTLIACNNPKAANSKKIPLTVSDKFVGRDTSINSTNAYNNLFLDSNEIQKFITRKKLNDTLSDAIRIFYNVRNYQYAWFAEDGLIEQALSFSSLYRTEEAIEPPGKSLERRVDEMRNVDKHSVKADDPNTVETELELSLQFIRYALIHYNDMGISVSSLGTFIPAKRKEVLELTSEVLSDNNANNKNYAASNEPYRLLKDKLERYSLIQKNGGWAVLNKSTKQYRLGASNSDVVNLKRRLISTGELSVSDTGAVFDTSLQQAIKVYQTNNGYKATGKVDAGLLDDLSVPVLVRIQQLLLNMQRMRWMPDQASGLLIKINIPEFVVYVDSGKTTLFQMDVVVGAEGHKTTMFSGNLNQVVFSPYWNIPPGIAGKEIVPGLKRDKGYLSKRNMERVGTVGFRQKPGPRNALGKVKFLFPNDFSIYMHDTPQKGLFDRDERGLSHGCIRLSDARKMAVFLLRDKPKWTTGEIDKAMNSGKEQFVKLEPTVAVIITYYTAWVDGKGTLHFANDLYKHDELLARKMFTNPQKIN